MISHLSSRIFGAVVLLSLAWSCTEPTAKKDRVSEKKPDTRPAIVKKPGSSFSDTLTINSPSAVFYNPDSLQMEKINRVNEKATLDMIKHDCYYKMKNAKSQLEKYWPKIKIIEVYRFRYLVFVKADGNRTDIDLDSKNDICGLFLFDGEKAPILADMPNINTVAGFYFKKQ